MAKSQSLLRLDDIRAAALRLEGVTQRTPMLHDAELDSLAHNVLLVKCENLQRAGAFKIRGAYNRLAQLSEEESAHGVVAFSSGNHAQGVALAARLLGIAATVVMPADASRMKLQATRRYGATVVTYNRKTQDRELIANQICIESHATLIPPYNDYRIMAGQGTAALELLEDVPDLDALLVPLGGGGLLAGSAVAAKALRPAMAVYGVEPEKGDDWARSWKAKKPVSIPPPDTIADGLRVTTPGDLTWPVVSTHADGVLTVSDEEIRRAMRLLMERLKIVVEPSGAVGVAAAISGRLPFESKRVGVIISGGNIDLDRLCRLLSDEEGVE